MSEARTQWLESVKDNPGEYERRTKPDFLLPVDRAGKVMDFHALRHTCGAWLAIAGIYPRTIQEVMRHASIELTMGTYGHLLPGATADAIKQMSDGSEVEPLQMTGIDGISLSGCSPQCYPVGTRNIAKHCDSVPRT